MPEGIHGGKFGICPREFGNCINAGKVDIQAVFKNFRRSLLFAVLGLAMPALVGCDKFAPLKSAKAKLDKLKEAKQEAAPVAPGSAPGSAAKPVTAPPVQAAAKPEVEQFSKGWLPPGMSRGEVKVPQPNQRPQPAQKP